MSKILLVGNDSRLLTTRSAILASTKASVACCNAVEAIEALQSERFDLVILCHSLTGEQTNEVTGLIQQRSPGAKILMIAPDPSQVRPPNGVPVGAIVSPDPVSLVRRVSELLRRQIHLVETSTPTKEAVKPQSQPKTNGNYNNYSKNNNLH